jgi:hypothetical protein
MSRQAIGLTVCSVILVASAFLGILMLDRQFSDRRNVRMDEAYIAWCKLTGRNDLSKDELYSLQRADLLKGYYKVDNQLNNK